MGPIRIVALDGDETGQELLEQALRVIEPDVVGLEVEVERFDLVAAEEACDRERRRARGR